MFRNTGDLDAFFPMFQDLRRRMDAVWATYEDDAALTDAYGPRVTVEDQGQAFFVRADVPGLSEKDVTITLHQDVLTVAGERKADTVEGYRPLRQERGAFRFSRSFSLPSRVDAEKVTATVKHGVLQVHLPKVQDAQPRQISVRAA
jgi:HSP20 family protein